MKVNTQKYKVIRWLEKYGTLTTKEAVIFLDIMSLAKRIEELRNDGYRIDLVYKTSPTGARYGVYKLIKREAKQCTF